MLIHSITNSSLISTAPNTNTTNTQKFCFKVSLFQVQAECPFLCVLSELLWLFCSHPEVISQQQPQCYAVTHFFLFPLKGTNIYLEEGGGGWFRLNGLLSPCLAELAYSRQWLVPADTGTGRQRNSTNVHSLARMRLRDQSCENASVIVLMTVLANSMYSWTVQYILAQWASKAHDLWGSSD